MVKPYEEAPTHKHWKSRDKRGVSVEELKELLGHKERKRPLESQNGETAYKKKTDMTSTCQSTSESGMQLDSDDRRKRRPIAAVTAG